MLEISDFAMAKDEKGNIEVACATRARVKQRIESPLISVNFL
jgi:hypothetical protein